MAIDRKYGVVTFERGTIGEDEPVFVIRAKDLAAEDAVLMYRAAAEDAGAKPELLDEVWQAARAIGVWQEEHPHLLKVPD